MHCGDVNEKEVQKGGVICVYFSVHNKLTQEASSLYEFTWFQTWEQGAM